MANSNAFRLVRPSHMITPNGTGINVPLDSSCFGISNYNMFSNNNNNDNNNRLSFHHQTNSKNNILEQSQNIGRDFRMTVQPSTVGIPPTPWPDISHPPLRIPFPKGIPMQLPSPQSRIHIKTSSSHGTSYHSPTPEGDSAFSDMSSMTSSKVHEDGLHCHWDHASISDSAKDSAPSPEDDDGYGVQGHCPQMQGHRPQIQGLCPQRPINGPINGPPAPYPIGGSVHSNHGCDDGDMDSASSYKWDVYDILKEEDIQADTASVDMDLCSVASDCGHEFGDEDPPYDPPYDPEDPIHGSVGGSSDVPAESKTSNSKPERLSESELLCFLRLLERREDAFSIRYTIEQFITCIPVTVDVEFQKHRTTSMSIAENEIFRRLLHLAPRATHRQVIHSMRLLPFILKSLGEIAISGKRDETLTKDRLHRIPERSRSRSRSNSSAISRRRRHRSRSRSAERRIRLKSESSPRRSPSSGRRRASKTFDDDYEFRKKKGLIDRGRKDFMRTQNRRTTEAGCRWDKPRNEQRPRPSGKRFVRLSHLEDEEAETASETKDSEKQESNGGQSLWKRPRKSIRKYSGSSCVEINRRRDGKVDLPMSRAGLPPHSPFLVKSTTGDEGAPRHSNERISSLLDIDFSTPGPQQPSGILIPERIRESTECISPGAGSVGRELGIGQGPRGGLLPDPGTTAYRTVIDRAVTSRLGISSPMSQR